LQQNSGQPQRIVTRGAFKKITNLASNAGRYEAGLLISAQRAQR
jgi:hypothetical protein